MDERDGAEASAVLGAAMNDGHPGAFISSWLEAGLDRLEQRYEEGAAIDGLSTGLVELDGWLGGLAGGQLLVVAGRPGHGRTSLGLSMAVHAATQCDRLAVVFSLEMRGEVLARRAQAAAAGVDSLRLRTGRLAETDWPRLSGGVGRLCEAPLFIEDRRTATVAEVEEVCRGAMERSGHPLGLVVVDTIQSISAEGATRDEAVISAARDLRRMAGTLGVPVVATAPVRRSAERRPDRRPTLADLDAPGLEDEADVVLLLYRGELYYPADPSLRRMMDVMVAKNREGPAPVMVQVAFLPEQGGRFATVVRGDDDDGGGTEA